MSVPEDLIKILLYHGFIRREHAVAFHRYVHRSKEEITANIDLLPTTREEIRLEKTLLVRAQSYRIFFKIFLGLDRLLKKKLTEEEYARAMANYKKSINHIVVNLPHDPIEKEKVKQEYREQFQGILEKMTFDVFDEVSGRECIFIPADAYIAIPTRSDDHEEHMVSQLGIPIERKLKELGLMKNIKTTNQEYDYDINQMLYYKIAPAIDVGLASGKLNQYEYDYILKFIRKIIHLKFLYQGVKKGEFDLEKDEPLIPSKTYLASNKVIDNAIKNLIKAGIDPETANAIRAKSYNRQEVKCINPHCNNIFVPINKKNNHCENCSQPDKYLKEWRASQADKKSRKSEPAPPPPEKLIYMRFINPDVFD